MITSEDLRKSAVVFDEASHTYRLGEKELSGITSLIHSVLRLGVYPDASDYVKNVQIPKAGYYGSCIHKSIQTWNEMGVMCTQFPEKEHPTAGTLPAQDVRQELDTYMRLKPLTAHVIASEFTVSYGDYASQTDEVWADGGENIYLVDFKSNNLDYYPGGTEGLKEYLSWQLSCYAFMFEHQTGKKVKGLYGMWLRRGDGERWKIDRKPDDQVRRLLETEAVKTDTGFAYFNPDMQVCDEPPVAAISDNALAVPNEVTKAIADLLRAEKAAKAMKERLRELMEQNGVTKWECPEFTATIGKESVSRTFDSAAFKKADPETYAKYVKEVSKKGSFIIKAK